MSYTAQFSFGYDDPKTARVVEQSLCPEVGTIQGDRSAASVERDGTTIHITITADDPTALRAAKATWFSLVRGADGAITAAR